MSVPLKLAFGVYVTVPSGLMATMPLGAVALVTVSGSPSGSLSFASTEMVTGVSSFVEPKSLDAVGPGFSTVQLKVVDTVPPLPSLAVTVTE